MAAKNNELEIVAVCDIDPEKLEKTAAQLDHVHPYTDYKTMLEEETPDLVAIATESGKHAQLALDCIRAGCHVIIEKPIALSIADADQIIEMAKQKGVFLREVINLFLRYAKNTFMIKLFLLCLNNLISIF